MLSSEVIRISKEKILQEFYALGTRFEVPKNALINTMVCQEKITHVYLLESGIVSLSSITPQGQTIIYQYFSQPGFLNIVPLLTRFYLGYENDMTVDLTAKTACVIYRLTVETFMAKLAEPLVKDLIIQTVLADYVTVMEKIRDSGEDSTKVNLYRFITQHASQDETGAYILDDFFTYTEIGNYLQVHEVTIARLMSELKRENIIAKQGKTLCIIDMNALERLK